MAARTRGIQHKIFLRVLAISVLPVVALGVGAFVILDRLADEADRSVAETHDRLADEVVGDEIRGSADAIRQELVRYLAERIEDARTWADSPTVREAAENGSVVAVTLGLHEVPIADLETQFAANRRLLGDETATSYLIDETTRTPFFAEVFFTNEFGHNVAASGVTSDFVQSDEAWWENAWDQGVDVGAVGFDESAEVFSTDISVRIEDPTSGSAVGVLKAVLDVSVISEVAERAAAAGDLEVTVLDPTGRVLADTASDYTPETELADVADLDDEGVVALGNAARTAEDGHLLGDRSVYGFSTTSPAESELGLVVIVRQSNELAFTPIGGVRQLSDDMRVSTDQLSIGLVVILLPVVAFAFTTSILLARTIVRPLRELRDAAHDVAKIHLPRIVAEIEQSDDAARTPMVPMIRTEAGAEIEELAEAFNSVQTTAVRMASEQTVSGRRNVAQAFVNMGRRDRDLLGRQASLVEQLQGCSSGAAGAALLARLEQVSVRLQRNAENLLVLAGEDAPGAGTGEVSITDVITSASTVLVDEARITFGALDPIVIPAVAVADLAHLLAELLDNALTFSPSESSVTIVGRLTPQGYRLSISDRGIGIAQGELEIANDRLRRPHEIVRSAETRLGLFVIGNLAARHDIEIELIPDADGGLVAEIIIPFELIDAPPVGVDGPAVPDPDPVMDVDPIVDETWAVEPAAVGLDSASIWPAAFSPIEDPGAGPMQSGPMVDRQP